MSAALQSLIESGTKLWLDSIDPDLVVANKALGATGATSNPIIVSNLLKTGRFDDAIEGLIRDGQPDEDIAWQVTDRLVQDAQRQFIDVWTSTGGNDGYVSFELDPLLEDPDSNLTHQQCVDRYIELGKKWANGHNNRMIKVPATRAGLGALEELCAAGVTLNVTLIFTQQQYELARDAIWRGAQRRDNLDGFKSVYSIFVSRVDVYTEQHVSQLSNDAQGIVGIANAQKIWQQNTNFWADKNLPLQQEMIFASTGTKKPEDPAWKYVAALAGSDIQTNPPATNEVIAASDQTFLRTLDQPQPTAVTEEIEQKVDFEKLHTVLMEEGVAKFVAPQKALLELIADKRAAAE